MILTGLEHNEHVTILWWIWCIQYTILRSAIAYVKKNLASSDGSQWLSRIVGNVGNRFLKASPLVWHCTPKTLLYSPQTV